MNHCNSPLCGSRFFFTKQKYTLEEITIPLLEQDNNFKGLDTHLSLAVAGIVPFTGLQSLTCIGYHTYKIILLVQSLEASVGFIAESPMRGTGNASRTVFTVNT